MGVPILRLPFVALKVLVDHFNRVELVAVSLLSKRADWFLKTCGKKNISFFNLEGSEIEALHDLNKLELFLLESRRQRELPEWNFKLRCYVVDNLVITISCKNFVVNVYFEILENIEKFEGIRKNLKIGESFVPVMTSKENCRMKKIHTFWNNNTDGLVAIMDYFKNDFNLPIEPLMFAGKDTRAIRTVVNHINSTQTVVRKVTVGSHPPLSENDFKFILENVSATDDFYLYSKLGQNFKFDGTIRAKNIYIEHGYWFTFQNLSSSNELETISVHGSNYTKEELQEFLEEWKSGKFPILKEVNCATKEYYSNVTSGFEKRSDKCTTTWGLQVEAIRGFGDSYGIVYPIERGHRYLRMRFYSV